MKARGVGKVIANPTVRQMQQTQQQRDLTDEALAKLVAEQRNNKLFPTADVREQWLFGWEVERGNLNIEVEADDKKIILEGQVDTADQYRQMVEAVRAIPAVRSVDTTGFNIDRNYWGYGGYPYCGSCGDRW